MSASSIRSQTRWFVVLLLVGTLGNVGAFALGNYLGTQDIRLAHAIPWIFLLVPLTAILMAVKGGLLKSPVGQAHSGLDVRNFPW